MKDRCARAAAVVSGVAVMAATAALAGAPTAPMRKAGWWSISTQAGGAGAQTMQMCTDAAMERQSSALGNTMGQSGCSAPVIAAAPGGWSFRSSCKVGNMTTSTSGTATGDFQTSYRVVAVTKMTPPPTPSMAEMKVTIDAKWLGACPKDRVPGDIVMPGGVVANVNKMAGRPK